MTDFTLSPLAVTVDEGGTYSFTITPNAALDALTTVRWEIVANGKIPISSGDVSALTGTLNFAASATAGQTISFTAADDGALEFDQNFEIRVYEVVTGGDDILLGAQAVRLYDNDAPTDTGAESFGVSAGAANAESNVFVAASTQKFELNGKGGDDTYIITRYQSGDVKIAESAGTDLIKFDYGVFIERFGEVSTSNFVRLKIESAILTLSTGAKIEIEYPDRWTSFQLGDGEIITSYAAFKTAIGASGTNATATFIDESYDVTTFTTVPDISANTIAVAAEVLGSSGLSDVIGLGRVADVRANGAGGGDIFVITRFQSGDVDIKDTVGTNLIKFDFGVSITGFAEVSRISFGALTVSLATLTLSTGAEIEIAFPGGAFRFQLGDDTVIETYADFKTAIGASGANTDSILAGTYIVLTDDTIGTVTITHAETSAPTNAANVGEVLTADTTGITDTDDADLTFTYQWKLGGANIIGATASTHKATATGAYGVTVTATDSVKNVNTVFTSTATTVVAEITVTITHVELSLPSDKANVGETLTADITGLTDADDSALTFTYQWKLAGSDVASATAKTYTPTAAGSYSVIVTAIDSVKSVNTPFTSAATTVVAEITVTITHAETYAPTGVANVGETLTADITGLTDTNDNTLTLTYQWKLGGTDIATGGIGLGTSTGATAKTYTPTEIGDYSVVVTATDSVKNVDTDITSAAFNVVAAKPKLIDASDYTEFKIGDGSGADILFAFLKTSAQLIQGVANRDIIVASTYGDVVAGGEGVDMIWLNVGADTVVHRFASGGTDWTNSDGADTIKNFQRGTDKFVFVDIDGTPITNVADFIAALSASDIEARVKTEASTAGQAGSFSNKISKLEIRFGTSGEYLKINFDDANLQTYASVRSSLASTSTPQVYKVTDFAIFDDLFSAESLDITSIVDLGVTIL